MKTSNLSWKESVQLRHWPPDLAARLKKLICRFAHKNPKHFAVFDADNTIWKYCLDEALLAYLEFKGVLSRRAAIAPLELVPFKKDESLYSYHCRLCEIDRNIGYLWIDQMFSGLSLRDLKRYVDELYAYEKPIPVSYYQADILKRDYFSPPSIYPAQRELIHLLMDNAIDVYVISTESEELVRMVASDPKYGIAIPPENVIGLNLLLRDPETGNITTARLQIERGHFFDEEYSEAHHYSHVFTSYPFGPLPFYVGKIAAIKGYIHPFRKPILAAGDSPNDYFMFFYCDVEHGGLRLWVNHQDRYLTKTKQVIEQRRDEEKALGMKSTADKGWLFVRAEQL